MYERYCILSFLPSPSMMVLSMPDTGSFILRFVEGELSSEGKLVRLTQVDAECAICSTTSTLVADGGLVDSGEEVTMVCPSCQAHQRVSPSRFERFLRNLSATGSARLL